MADTNVQDHIGRGPATPPLADMAEEPVPVTAQTPAPAGAAAQTTAPGGTPPSRTTADGASPAPREGGRERGAYGGRRRVCGFCVDNVQRIDYKDTVRLRRFLSERGKIEPRRKTGTCAKHQRWLTTALKRARELALLPYTAEHVRFMGR
jgi:small subunit ribosomal protein S18